MQDNSRSATPPTAGLIDPAPSPNVGRLGSKALLSADGDEVGTFEAALESDERVRVEVTLTASSGPQPWGIYDLEECEAPPQNRDAPFQFADIEGGTRTEFLETPAYLEFPENLVVIVFGPVGGAIDGCANLGPPEGPSASPPLDGSCAPDGSAGPSADAGSVTDLAFTAEGLSNADIYVIKVDGSGRERLTTRQGVDMKPSWSPDGSKIAFRSSRDGQDEIYVMNADGTCQRNLTQTSVDDRSPAWSPDACSIAYDHFFDERYQDIAVMPASGGPARRVTTESGEYPSWSPDGTRIAFASARDGDYDIYVINADGTGETRLTNDPGYQMYPAWSPDGRWIAYESGPDSIEGLLIHLMAADGTGDRVVTTDSATNRFPAWASDGRLAWSSSGTLVVADSFEGVPVPVGSGEFPAWRAWTNGSPRNC